MRIRAAGSEGAGCDTGSRLDPFVEPSLCVARLTEHEDASERQPAADETR